MPTKYYDEMHNKASQKYHATHIKQIKFGFSIEQDADILAQLDSVPNKQGYIKDLIRADIATRAKSYQNTAKEEPAMRKLIPLATVLLSDSSTERQTISYDPVSCHLYSDADPDGVPVAGGVEFSTEAEAIEGISMLYPSGSPWELEWIEPEEE